MSKKIFGILTLVSMILLSFVASGASPSQDQAARPLTNAEEAGLAGGGAWGEFLSGVACGAGIVVMASGYASGLGAPAALLMTAGTLRACASAFGI